MTYINHSIKSVVVLLSAITLFACEGNYENVQKMNMADNAPIMEGKGINLKYTDSGRVVNNLITEEFLDFSNMEEPYQEFPKGVTVYFWDEENKKNTITSEYAINFINTEIVDLRDNVVLVMSDSTILNAEQLYWDQKNEWVFTDQPYQIKLNNGTINNGEMFDSSQDFTSFFSRKNVGVQIIDNSEKNKKTNGE